MHRPGHPTASPMTGAFPGRNAPVSFCAPGRRAVLVPRLRHAARVQSEASVHERPQATKPRQSGLSFGPSLCGDTDLCQRSGLQQVDRKAPLAWAPGAHRLDAVEDQSVTWGATRRRAPRCRCMHATTPVGFPGVGVARHPMHPGGLRSHRADKQAPPSEMFCVYGRLQGTRVRGTARGGSV